MPRQKLYKTREEQEVANRAKSQRYYVRHKAEISARRQSAYQSRREPHKTTSKQIASLSAKTDQQCALPNLDKFRATYHRLLSNSSHTFFNSLYVNFLQALVDSPFDAAAQALDIQIKAFEDLHREIMSFEGAVLTFSGNRGHAQLLEVARPVHRVIHCLQDLWCNGTDGPDALRKAFDNGALLFQD